MTIRFTNSALVLLLSFSIPTLAENRSADSSAVAAYSAEAGAKAGSTKEEELNRRSIERRAVEAVIWGMPAVNYERMLQAALANGAKGNQVVYWSRPVNWKNQTLTPNPDTIYLNPFYDTKNGPIDRHLLGPAAPAGKESNSVPTDPKRQFELLFRLYGPKKELFEKTWKLPDVQEVK